MNFVVCHYSDTIKILLRCSETLESFLPWINGRENDSRSTWLSNWVKIICLTPPSLLHAESCNSLFYIHWRERERESSLLLDGTTILWVRQSTSLDVSYFDSSFRRIVVGRFSLDLTNVRRYTHSAESLTSESDVELTSEYHPRLGLGGSVRQEFEDWMFMTLYYEHQGTMIQHFIKQYIVIYEICM